MFHIKKYTEDYSRRIFLEKTSKSILGAGVLASAWNLFAKTGDTKGAYPDEITSIEVFSKGQLKSGDQINADNVELVKNLLDPIRYKQIKEMGRVLTLAPTTSDLYKLNPAPYLEATLRNNGKARFDTHGNVVTNEGKPWIGGNPFPEPKSGVEVFAAHTLSWGRHDSCFYAAKEFTLDINGDLKYEYSTGWAELATVGRVSDPKNPYLIGKEDKLRLQSIFFTSPTDIKGVSFLNIWPYDQRLFPELYGYMPAFKRIRRFPTNQRFETLNPGSELYLSDAWAAGDPFLTWGDYKIISRGPQLGAVSNNWNHESSNWAHKTHGGPKNNLFWDTTVELIPEVIVVEAKPNSYPRAPISKKQVWFDARTLLPLSMISYDRSGKPFRFFDGSFSQYEKKGVKVMNGEHPYWSWTAIHAFNIQTNRMTRIEQVKEVDGHKMLVNNPQIYDKYLRIESLQQFGG